MNHVVEPIHPSTPAPGPPLAGNPEKRNVTLGLVPLNDCAPIAVALEKGLFAEVGVDVTTTREQSWAGIRDKVAFGLLDGAQMLATMPICATLGVGGFQCDMTAAMSLGLNGNAITLAEWLCEEIEEAHGPLRLDASNPADGLAEVIRGRARAGKPRLRLGSVFPVSTHELELRYWLAAAGIDPDADVELVVVPPPRMVEALRAGELSGYCVGEPWNSLAIAEGLGRIVVSKHAIWNHSPEKVLGFSTTWAQRHPDTVTALITAVIQAGQWLDEPANRLEAAEILSLPQYVGVSAEHITPALTGQLVTRRGAAPQPCPAFHVFHRGLANFPWVSHGLWFVEQMHRWGWLDTPYEAQLAVSRVFRDDLYRQAAERLGLGLPDTAEKSEGTHAAPWTLAAATGDLTMGADRFLDGAAFEPAALDLRHVSGRHTTKELTG